jgi:hypothetical protein
MARAEYQLVTLKRALDRHGVVCRMRADRDSVRVDLFWRPPRVKRNMRPFLSAVPLALMKDLTGKGFAPVNEVPIDGLFKNRIVAASFASSATEAATLARAIIESHGLTNSDRIVAWAPTASEGGSRVVRRQPADEVVEAMAP